MSCSVPIKIPSFLAQILQTQKFASLIGKEYAKTPTPRKKEPNLYKDLVDKYEALAHVRPPNKKPQHAAEENELHTTKDTDEESGHGDSLSAERKNRKNLHFSLTPTDFSEAETSSSGYSGETSNKATQTDKRPGSFLCTINDGEECFSIYEDAATNIAGRFRNRPEYRELFSEIFSVLRKAAKNKDDNKDLPLLDDNEPVPAAPKVPPVTPCTENLPDFPDNCTDDTQSVLSSAMSELSTTQFETVSVTDEKKDNSPESGRTLVPLVRKQLDYISVSTNVRKRSSSRRKKHHNMHERNDSPATHIVGSPKITYTNRLSRRHQKHADNENWNGNTLHFYGSNRNIASPTPSQGSGRGNPDGYPEIMKPSAASQELHKLKKLDMTYADVVRKVDQKKNMHRYRRK